MIWTDSDSWLSEDDLRSVDREVTDVAAYEKIPLSGTNGVIRRGINEAALEIMSEALQSFQSFFAPSGVPWNHYLAVMNTGSGSPYGNTLRLHLSQVVVDWPIFGSWSAVKEFCVQHVLKSFYASALARKDPDRYSEKYERIDERLRVTIRPMLFANGLPCVSIPLSAPGATGEPGAGTWSAANLSSIAGGSNAAIQPIDAAITFTGPKWTAAETENAESAGSQRVRSAIQANNLLQVDITSLNPPTGVQPRPQGYLGSLNPMKATGWLLYVGSRNGILYRQTATPIPIATKTYALAADPVTESGHALGLGQSPDVLFTISRTMARG